MVERMDEWRKNINGWMKKETWINQELDIYGG